MDDKGLHRYFCRELFQATLSLKQIRVENWLQETNEKKCGVGEVNLEEPMPCFVKILKGEADVVKNVGLSRSYTSYLEAYCIIFLVFLNGHDFPQLELLKRDILN